MVVADVIQIRRLLRVQQQDEPEQQSMLNDISFFGYL
jgi:hypothetical protein